MKNCSAEQPNGYLETIQSGLAALNAFDRTLTRGKGSAQERIKRLKREMDTADAIVVGAGAGLSTSAGMTYSGTRFEKYFFDFAARFGIRDMYSGGFFPFPDDRTRWAWWARMIYVNRYCDPEKPVYPKLLSLLKGKDYFVITTNVDHQFQRAGAEKDRLFYTQGDYGLFQSVRSSQKRTYDNEDWVMKALEAQGFVRAGNGKWEVPQDRKILMQIPEELIPRDPQGGPVTMNLRADESFVEDEGWHRASAAYSDFLHRHAGLHVLFLELGVGSNTPVIIKYPFWQMTASNPLAVYACINYGEAYCPREIEAQSICIEADIGEVLDKLD